MHWYAVVVVESIVYHSVARLRVRRRVDVLLCWFSRCCCAVLQVKVSYVPVSYYVCVFIARTCFS